MRNIDDPNTGQPKGFRIGFEIFMVIVYIAVGFLFIFGVFTDINTTISCVIGGLLIAYGIWRAVRAYLRNKDS